MIGKRMARGFITLFILFMLSLALSIPTVEAQPGKATFYMVNQDELGQRLSDEEMSKIRGGFLGMAFGVYFTGFWDNVGAMEGSLTVNTSVGDTATVPSVEIGQTVDGVQISAAVGTIQGGSFQGSSGIFQLSIVPGSFNIVNNNLFVQIAIVNVMNGGQIPSLSSLLGW